jgi:hypothetical protein
MARAPRQPSAERPAPVAMPPGVLYWPRAYDDLVGYTFAISNITGRPVRGHGFNDVLADASAARNWTSVFTATRDDEDLEATTSEVCRPANTRRR